MPKNELTKQNSLNRSFSFSGSKVCIEQSFKNLKGETLVRQYSCEQIYDPSNNATVRQFKQSYIVQGLKDLDFKTPALDQKPIPTNKFEVMSNSSNFTFSKKCAEQKGFEETLLHNKNRYQQIDESTPMEIDTSTEETCMSDVHHTPIDYAIVDNAGDISEHRSKVSKLLISPTKSKIEINATVVRLNRQLIGQTLTKYLKFITLFLIPVCCAFLLMRTNIFLNNDDLVSDNFDAENITDALQDLLYGQQNVINDLKEEFKNIDDNLLIIFVGGMGVGKTYAANIIANNFQWKDNIVKIISPQYKNSYEESKFLKSISRYGYNLVVIDNLEFQDRQSVIPFVNKIFSSNKKGIVLLVFTIPEYSLDMKPDKTIDIVTGSKQISTELTDAKLHHKLIVFDKLTEDVVKRCIRYAMAKKGLIINKYNIDQILQNINFEYSGCKGVYSKVALLK